MAEEKNISEGKTTDDSPQSTDENLQQKEENLQPATEPELIPNDSVEQTTISNTQTPEKMEVHHHGHVHEKKKWKEYVFQFFMLFLAVFCGFLAEYQLEHKIEKNREKQFMKSIVEDLKADTSSIATLIQHRKDRLQMADSISTVIIEKKYLENGAAFYHWGRNISRRAFFYSADGTMQQLKNSGGLRLISNTSIADKIIAYDVLYRGILSQQELEEVQLNEYRGIAGRIFDAAVFKKMVNIKDTVIIEKPEGNPQLKDGSPDALNELANKLNYWTVGAMRLQQFLGQLKEKATVLIELIKKEYHLE